MAERKVYVVWKGLKPGIYLTWDECKQQVTGFVGALYKSFPNIESASIAYNDKPHKYLGTQIKQSFNSFSNSPIYESISVDGAWNTATGVIEYQGVHTGTKKLIFHQGPHKDGTNNVAEFLALVHALAFCNQNRLQIPIYSDSITAIAWVRNKKAKTELIQTTNNINLFDLIKRAEHWLKTYQYSNKILKWETPIWGEIPADFGRK